MHRYLLRLSVILFSIILYSQAVAQSYVPLQGFGVEGNFLGGKIIKHTSKFLAPIPSLSAAFDVNMVWQTYGTKDWQQGRNFPLMGLGFTYINYGNNAVFGQCVGIYPNLQIPLIRREKWEWTFRFGDGLGYVTRKYQITAPVDTLNNAIGSHLNDFAMFMTDFRYRINKHWDIQAGANFTHISNADFHSPNLGVNLAGTHIGIRYFPINSTPKLIIKDPPKLNNRWLAEIRLGISFKEARAKDSLTLPTYLTSVYVSRRWLGKNKFFAGIDYAYHEDVYAFLINYAVDKGREKQNSWDGGVFAGNEFLVGRVGFMTQVGVYYKQTFLKFDPVYEKIGCNFYIIKKEHGPIKEFFTSAMLLTHFIVAEYAEFGIGAGF